MMRNNMQVLVTGASGFIGKQLCKHLLEKGYWVRAIGRKKSLGINHSNLYYSSVDILDGSIDWLPIMHGTDVVIHLASRVHHLKDKGMHALAEYQAVNVNGTKRIARAAIKSLVRRFIYVSTIKVNGERTFDMPLRAEDHPRPQDAYSLSKLQGEQILQEQARRSGMEWVIIRPPLVYGPEVRGNFRRLITLSNSNLPLPMRSIRNKRSLVSVYNLNSFIECCLAHPNAHGEVFLVSDNEDLSTAQLIRALRKANGKKSALYPFPLGALKLLAFVTGKYREMSRILDSLQVNIEKSARLLDWRPPFTVEEALQNLYREEFHRI